ncbi:fibronectin type III domain-containing protein [Thermanaeromonas toyohensis]|uniref:fibronectin type III domain-containing protein n=1 Tax=Thermanaeromonas toyohensis TaxID=161154 RepID=UPI0012F514BE|nr:fibronectin type III domain-containing protein [Thermanaeromonas toyohensis]
MAGASATQNSITLNINRNGIPSGVNIHVYRNGNLVGTISDASSVFTDTGLQPGTSYTYTLRAEYLGEWGPVSPAFSYRTVPPTPSAPSASTSIIRWSQTVGRGRVVLTWPAVNGATGYKVWVFDGNTYRGFDVGNTTTWDSSAAKIYPDPNWLGVQPDNSISSDPFNHQGAGFDLQDDPNLLYRKTVGTAYDNAHNYWFRVSAYNESGEAPMSGACTVALPLATDQEPPSVSVSATSKQGFKKTYTPDIYVAVSASDSLSKLRSIELSNDGVSYTRLYEVPLNPDGSTSVGNYSGIFEWTVLPGAETKIIYVRVVDAVGNSTVATDAVVLAEDVLPPSVQLKINGGAEFTTQPLVTLTLSAYDNTSPVSQLKMRFSNDGNLWSPWQPFQESMLWDIANGLYGGSGSAGIKKVYAQVVDQAENVALVVAQIGYNPNPPNGSVTIMNARPGIWEGELAFFITTDKPSIALNIPGAVQMRFDLGTGTYSDWESYAIQKTVLLPKYQGAVRLRVQTKDAYGVISKASDLLVVVDSVAPTIQRLRGLNGATATTSSSITLEISATDNLPGQLQYQYQVNGGSWSSWANLSGNTINVSGLTSGANRIAVNVKDLAGNVSSATVTIFRI